jgi:aminoglycoside phosphotransferase (APT) family kinase protein
VKLVGGEGLEAPAGLGRDVRILDREVNENAWNGRSEILTIQVGSRPVCKMLRKLELVDGPEWSNLAYEAEVYRRVLGPLGVPAPELYGFCEEVAPPRRQLDLEYLDGAVSLYERWSSTAIAEAAGILGRFHAAAQALLAADPLAFLHRYGPVYYREHARHVVEALRRDGGCPEWLERLYEGFAGGALDALLTSRCTIVHGDVYLNNVLVCEGDVYLVDWEMAGVDAGELDLAELLLNAWDDEVRERCMLEYAQARWPSGGPADFHEVVDAGRICLGFHNLGSRGQDSGYLLGHLRAAGERLGLVR